jgi:hypothetical protein
MDSTVSRLCRTTRALCAGLAALLILSCGGSESSFTVVVLPDTQFYVAGMHGGTPGMFESQTRWIVTNREALNVVFVTQLGDCVEHGDAELVEWQRADAAMSLLDDPEVSGLSDGIPFGIAVGNHDQSPIGDADGATGLYNQFFGESRFEGRAYYGGHHGRNNDNHYQLFSAGRTDFIIVHLEYDTSPDEDVLDWADDLLKEHSDRKAIVVTHYLIGSGSRPAHYPADDDGPASFSQQGTAIYDALKDNPNLFLMLGGHIGGNGGEGRRVDTWNGNRVYSLLSDYQSRDNGGNGLLRIMQFHPDRGEIVVRTFSPYANDGEGLYERDEDSEFILEYDPDA